MTVIKAAGDFGTLVGSYVGKRREVCIKTRLSPASLAITGQVTKHTTIIWSIQLKINDVFLFLFRPCICLFVWLVVLYLVGERRHQTNLLAF